MQLAQDTNSEMGQPSPTVTPEQALARIAGLVAKLYQAVGQTLSRSETYRTELDVIRYTEARAHARIMTELAQVLDGILASTEWFKVHRGEVIETPDNPDEAESMKEDSHDVA